LKARVWGCFYQREQKIPEFLCLIKRIYNSAGFAARLFAAMISVELIVKIVSKGGPKEIRAHVTLRPAKAFLKRESTDGP
jgi:hypothetical protein